MTCPNCSGEVWDNAEKVAGGWKGPLKKCKAECGFIVWPPKTKASPASPKGAWTAPKEPKWTWSTLAETYHQSLLIARKQVLGLATVAKFEATTADILAAAATVFIAATRDGVKVPPTLAELSEKSKALATSDVADEDMPF
jgi:hypothetical protein